MQQEVSSVESVIQLKYVIKPAKIATILGIVSLYLALQSLFNEYLIEKVLSSDSNGTVIALLDLFSVNAESSIPTWYSVLLLFTAALLLGAITWAKWRHGDRLKYYWAGLSMLFVYLALDEGAAIHEIFSDPLQTVFHSTGYLSFGWEIVAAPLVILVVLLYLPFILQLAPRWRYLFVSSGLVYVAGAFIFEAISANRWYSDSGITFAYLAIGTVEELFEMLGVVLFIYTLLAYMAENNQPHALTFLASVDPEAAASEILSNRSSGSRQGLVISLVVFLLVANAAVFIGVKSLQQHNAAASSSESLPFYQQVIDQYGGQNVVVLRVNGAFLPGNPVTQQVAASLLVLFNDVTVVSFPQENLSVAFASSTSLPFDKDNLRSLLLANDDDDFVIFDTQEIAAAAQGDVP